MEKVLVIIVTYNGEKWIEKCVNSINPQKGIDGLVVDNGSTDRTLSLIKNTHPEVKIINPGQNLGFGQGNNLGFDYAIAKGYDYVYLLNQDAWVSPEGILEMVEISKRNPEYGIISPLHAYADGTTLDKDFYWALPKDLAEDFILKDTTKEIYDTERLIPAAHWLVAVEGIKKVGGFSPAFIHFGEDDNLFQRFQYKGFKAGISPKVIGIHDRGDRTMDKAYKIRILKGGIRHLLSDPGISHFPYKKMLKKLLLQINKYGIGSLSIYKDIIKDYGRIRKMREESRKEGAFLQQESKGVE